MKLKHLPNALTIARIILALSLIPIRIFLEPQLGLITIIVFTFAGMTDMFDGPIARRVPNAKSKLGAELDSLADMLLVIVAVFVIVPAMEVWSWIFWGVLCVLTYKLMSLIPAFIKHRKPFLLHTYSNKMLAVVLFIAPLMYFIVTRADLPMNIVNAYIVFALFFVVVATTEEILIISLLRKPFPDIQHIGQVREVNEKFDRGEL